jgi:hypothetical protein
MPLDATRRQSMPVDASWSQMVPCQSRTFATGSAIACHSIPPAAGPTLLTVLAPCTPCIPSPPSTPSTYYTMPLWQEHGLWLCEHARGFVKENSFSEHNGCAIWIQSGSDPDVADNVIQESGEAGVLIKPGGERSGIFKPWSGIFTSNPGSEPHIRILHTGCACCEGCASFASGCGVSLTPRDRTRVRQGQNLGQHDQRQCRRRGGGGSRRFP